MAALIVEVANAVRDAIKGHAFTQPIEVKREYLPEFKSDQVDRVQLTVVARSKARGRASRGHYEVEIGVDVGIFRGAETTEDQDTMAALAEEVEEFLADDDQKRLTTADGTSVLFAGLTIDPVYDPGAIRQGSEFVQVLRCTYKAWVAS